MKDIHIRRLRQLYFDLKYVIPLDRLYMDTWKAKLDCGTTYCACGWYSTLHPEEKLKIECVTEGECAIFYKGATGTKAVADFFGIDGRWVIELFYRDSVGKAAKNSLLSRLKVLAEQYHFDIEPPEFTSQARCRVTSQLSEKESVTT